MEDTWDQWRKHVLIELERHSETSEEQNSKLNAIQVEIATLKVKSGVWGAAGALATIMIAIMVGLVTGVMGG